MNRFLSAWVVASQCLITVCELLRMGWREACECLFTGRQGPPCVKPRSVWPLGHVAKPKP